MISCINAVIMDDLKLSCSVFHNNKYHIQCPLAYTSSARLYGTLIVPFNMPVPDVSHLFVTCDGTLPFFPFVVYKLQEKQPLFYIRLKYFLIFLLSGYAIIDLIY